jgi:VanZ family protein
MPTSEPWRNPRPAPNLDEVRYRVPPKSFFPHWLRAWLPAIVWSVLIFFLSTDTFSALHTGSVIEPILRWLLPSLSPDAIDHLHFLIRKCAHFTEYFIFFILLYRGIRAGRTDWRWTWASAAWFIAAAYSCLDEIHQSFVASRTASPWDSLLDSTGALVALLLLLAFYRLRRSSNLQIGQHPRRPL